MNFFSNKRQKVIHLVPYDGVGGVESAARSMIGIEHAQIDFKVDYIYPPSSAINHRLSIFNLFYPLYAAYRVISCKPNLLIVSLWRSCIVGLLIKLFCPRLKLVLFLHCPNHVHWLDRLATVLMSRLSDQVWADSKATLTHRLPDTSTEKGRVISFVNSHISVLGTKLVEPVFIFWGRLHRQKGFDCALDIFASVHNAYPSARFIIIGPDGGDFARIQAFVNERDLSTAVSFLGEMNFDEIARQARLASFYLQTSLLEGMAMSVVEAMQLGLVPVVKPVGEIGHYCRHDENALIVESKEAVVPEILAVLNDEVKYRTLRKNALKTWENKLGYAESVLQACASILGMPSDVSELC